jgi:hypothetical protein
MNKIFSTLIFVLMLVVGSPGARRKMLTRRRRRLSRLCRPIQPNRWASRTRMPPLTQPFAHDPQLALTPGVIQPDDVPMIVSFTAPDDFWWMHVTFRRSSTWRLSWFFCTSLTMTTFEQWEAFGYWLNNRLPDTPTGDSIYQDPSWFPEFRSRIQYWRADLPFSGM